MLKAKLRFLGFLSVVALRYLLALAIVLLIDAITMPLSIKSNIPVLSVLFKFMISLIHLMLIGVVGVHIYEYLKITSSERSVTP